MTGTFGRTLTLQTGSMHQPMEAMRTCLDELITHWGFDAAVQRTLSRPVKPIDQMGWSRRVLNSYPVDMLRAGRSGAAHIRLIVGADGKPTSCTAYKGSADPAFGEHACKTAMRYARFQPALDDGGAPVTSYLTTTVVYQTSR